MNPVSFEGANKVLSPPSGESMVDYNKLPIYTDGVFCTSVWHLTDADIELINRTRGIIVGVRSGQTQHPIQIIVANSMVDPEGHVPADPNEDEAPVDNNIIPLVDPKDIIISNGEETEEGE